MTTVLARDPGTLPPGLKAMGWLGQVAIAIAHSGAPEAEWSERPAELAAAGVERLGAEVVPLMAEYARGLNLAQAAARDVRELAAARQGISDLWGSSKRMQAAYNAAHTLLRRERHHRV